MPNSRVEFAKEENSTVEEAGPRRTVQPRRRLGERLGLSGRWEGEGRSWCGQRLLYCKVWIGRYHRWCAGCSLSLSI